VYAYVLLLLCLNQHPSPRVLPAIRRWQHLSNNG
jgi:hypothetical protein